MNWGRSETLAIASPHCTLCLGLGLVAGAYDGPAEPCSCVMRHIFRACFRRYLRCLSDSSLMHSSMVLWEEEPRVCASQNQWRKEAEFRADFAAVARRTLQGIDLGLFRLAFLAGADYSLACHALHISRGEYFARKYVIEAKVGRMLAETTPYPLYPVGEYFERPFREGAPFGERERNREEAGQARRWAVRTDAPLVTVARPVTGLRAAADAWKAAMAA